jgi:hypothetical protein
MNLQAGSFHHFPVSIRLATHRAIDRNFPSANHCGGIEFAAVIAIDGLGNDRSRNRDIDRGRWRAYDVNNPRASGALPPFCPMWPLISPIMATMGIARPGFEDRFVAKAVSQPLGMYRIGEQQPCRNGGDDHTQVSHKVFHRRSHGFCPSLTGTNGKTRTGRLISHFPATIGLAAGFSESIFGSAANGNGLLVFPAILSA